jgi:pimeloyl-ACP methyl ester carboxylesterase
MKNLLLFFCLSTGLLIPDRITAQAAVDKQLLTGSWLGRISAGAVTLRVVFNLSLFEKDSLVATFDSPDQGAKNIKIGPVTLDGNILKIQAPLMLAEYIGTIKNDTLIDGTFKQAGNSLPLNLVKLKTAFVLKRPQEPAPPFPYTTEDVTFINEKFNIRLAGTLTIPEGEGPFPAAILITGSGSQNRNEELFGHKPFLVIADYLTRNGIAVLRYDDRGVGGSKGSPLNSTTADFATDAEAAFNFLKTRSEISSAAIGFIGHSEGGLIAPIVAASNQQTAFIISLAGMGVPGGKITEWQAREIGRLSGVNEKTIKKGISQNKKLLAVLEKEPDNKKAEEKMIALYRKILLKEKNSDEDIEKAVTSLKQTTPPVTYKWTRFYLSTDPAVYWKKVKCPVLALNGSKDLQVAADENLKAIEKALLSGGNKSVKTMKFPGLNHLFQHCKTGLVSEYGEIEETFSPEVLKVMTDWIHQL